MLSKNQIKLINQLKQKKYRIKHGLFLAEGIKTVKELLQSDFSVKRLFATADVLSIPDAEAYTLITEKELKKISQLKTPQTLLGVFKIPEAKIDPEIKRCVVLDKVRDPGNLGTIIRLCDWFGIEQLVCSPDTVDCYNPKTVQATMGSLARVNIVYTDLAEYLMKNQRPVYGTFMTGENIHQVQLPKEGLIVMGNEANGISRAVENQVDSKLAIPRFGKNQKTESLNVATATAIVLNEFMRS